MKETVEVVLLAPFLLLHRHYDGAIGALQDRIDVYRRVAAQTPELKRSLEALSARDGHRFFLKIIRTMKKLNTAASRQLLLALLLNARRNVSMPSSKPHNFLRAPRPLKGRSLNIIRVHR